MNKNNYSGKATVKLPDGKLYEGDVINSLPDGKGKMVFKNLDTYEGDWKNGQMEGFGTYKHYDSRKDAYVYSYEGMFVLSKFDGFGKMKYDNGIKYLGEWKEGKRCGNGELILQNGCVVNGLWGDDSFRKGMITYSNGDRYFGEFRDFYPEGYGTFVRNDGKIFQGIWRKGKLIVGAEYAEDVIIERLWKNELDNEKQG